MKDLLSYPHVRLKYSHHVMALKGHSSAIWRCNFDNRTMEDGPSSRREGIIVTKVEHFKSLKRSMLVSIQEQNSVIDGSFELLDLGNTSKPASQ